jgi:hypothetical protein
VFYRYLRALRFISAEFLIPNMRFIHFALLAYFTLVIGAAVALWKAGVLARVDEMWLAIGIVIVTAPAIVLAVTSLSATTITRE